MTEAAESVNSPEVCRSGGGLEEQERAHACRQGHSDQHRETLARDAGVLVHTQGFRLVAAGVANMFPHTAHVESITLFDREEEK